MAQASRDQNFVPTLLAVSNVDNVTPVTLYADPVTHRLLVSSSGGGGGGGISRVVSVISTNTAAGAASSTDYVYLVSGTTTVTLPTAASNTNRYTIKRVGVNPVTIATTSAQTIDGSASATLAVQYDSLDLISDGSNWNII